MNNMMPVLFIGHGSPMNVLGASHTEDEIKVFNYSCTLGSLSMTGYLFENGVTRQT